MNATRILVTGGTGSFGRAFIQTVLERYPDIARLVVFSRDELKQYEMAQAFPRRKFPNLRFFIGDIRDPLRIRRALEDIDTVVHAAALKQVPTAEYNPFECIATNVLGAQHLINGVFDCGVKRVVALSTDKAAAPINLYGATKLCSDKLFVAANNLKGKRDLRLSVVRYGNVMGSRGSVIPFFLERRRTGTIPITDPDMTRFNITLNEGVELVLHALEHALGGEIFVPKIPSYRITDVAEAIGPHCNKPIVGIRPGEKIHEEMITVSDSLNTIDCGQYFAILPSIADVDPQEVRVRYSRHHHGSFVSNGFHFSSDNNPSWLSVADIRRLIVEHIDPSFSVES